jgi:hypothetical protein
MFYFRDEEFRHLDQFLNRPGAKAMAVYGKRRTGKTRLLTEYIDKGHGEYTFLYFQCTSYDYRTCLKDFLAVAMRLFPKDTFLSSMPSFREAISLLSQILACSGPRRLLIVPGADHGMSYFTDPERYTAAVLDFWKTFDDWKGRSPK